MTRAAAVTIDVARRTELLDAPTPCTEYDVRTLVEHMLTWGPSLAGAGRKLTVPPRDDVRVDSTWATEFTAQVEDIAAAWTTPGAWEGTTHMGGPTELPAELVGGMVTTELLVHAWDLARAGGLDVTWDEDVLSYALAEMEKTADQGRAMGVYGPAVAVPDDAPALDRLLALSGRDPHWKP